LLLLTALRYGHEGLGYWLSRSAEESADKAVVDSLTSPRQEVREAALRALAGSIHPPDGSPVALDEEMRKNLHDRLAQAWRTASDQATRYASARALWLLRRFNKPAESLGVARDVFRYWLQEHALQLLSYLLTVGAVLLLVGMGLYVRERLRGQWRLVTSLKAGEVALVFPDPMNDQTLYALTQGGLPPGKAHRSLYPTERSGTCAVGISARAHQRPLPSHMIRRGRGPTSRFTASASCGVKMGERHGRWSPRDFLPEGFPTWSPIQITR